MEREVGWERKGVKMTGIKESNGKWSKLNVIN